MSSPVFDPGADRSTTRAEYSSDRRIARFLLAAAFDRAASDAAAARAQFAASLDAFNSAEYFEPLLAAARSRSRRSTMTVEEILHWASSRIAAGETPDQVLKDLAKTDAGKML